MVTGLVIAGGVGFFVNNGLSKLKAVDELRKTVGELREKLEDGQQKAHADALACSGSGAVRGPAQAALRGVWDCIREREWPPATATSMSSLVQAFNLTLLGPSGRPSSTPCSRKS